MADAYAAEHLEIHTRDARAVAMRVRNAGAVFVGPWSPVSLGDYCAGSNHVLPTAGAAAHVGGLSVQTFLRSIQVIEYDQDALAATAATVSDAGCGRGPAGARRRGAGQVRRRDVGAPPSHAAHEQVVPVRPELRAPHARTARRSSTCRCG